jgi:hypothetical protein
MDIVLSNWKWFLPNCVNFFYVAYPTIKSSANKPGDGDGPGGSRISAHGANDEPRRSMAQRHGGKRWLPAHLFFRVQTGGSLLTLTNGRRRRHLCSSHERCVTARLGFVLPRAPRLFLCTTSRWLCAAPYHPGSCALCQAWLFSSAWPLLFLLVRAQSVTACPTPANTMV